MGEEAALAHLQLARRGGRSSAPPAPRPRRGRRRGRGSRRGSLAPFVCGRACAIVDAGYKKARTFVIANRAGQTGHHDQEERHGGHAVKKIDDMEARLPRRLQARPGRARGRVVRHAGDRHAAELRRATPSTTTARTARRRSSWRCAAAARSRSRASASRSTPTTSPGSAPASKRKVWPGDDGIRLLVLGGMPGGAYEAPDITELGEPDPMAASLSRAPRLSRPVPARGSWPGQAAPGSAGSAG